MIFELNRTRSPKEIPCNTIAASIQLQLASSEMEDKQGLASKSGDQTVVRMREHKYITLHCEPHPINPRSTSDFVLCGKISTSQQPMVAILSHIAVARPSTLSQHHVYSYRLPQHHTTTVALFHEVRQFKDKLLSNTTQGGG